MQGFKTNYVNLIADNLRDRYDNGFPILKELIQNADDAKARQLIFGRHPGFQDSYHPLLRGSGLWFFNDGEFKENDADDLRSFGIGSKAGDTGAIGKFGLGMKSVFHLCEALFYVAWDGKRFHCEGLTPWKQDGQSLHKEWNETSGADWRRLKDLGKALVADGGKDCTWFLLWLPLRMRKHLQTHAGRETGAIINRFPGDDPAGELAFLNDEKLAHDMAEMLPLLRHLESVEHKGEDNHFVLRLADASRLMGDPPCQQTSGEVLWADGRQRLAFSGRRIEGPDTDGRFADMKAREEWPRTRYRDESEQEQEEKDKASPEGAVLFCSGHRSETSSRLHWAVFLPVEDGSEELGDGRGKRGHSLILHGQFFLDAGRKRIHDHEHLDQEPEPLGDAPIDESRLRRAWNQRLAQEAVLPLVLPTLEDHVGQHGLSDDECGALTGAISKSVWFRTFRGYICRDRVWLRTLEEGAGPRWRLVDGDSRPRLRPLPKPPGSAPERPWKVFPKLAACDIVPYDVEAPCLDRSNKPGEWPERELESLLSRLDDLFVDAPSMDYVIAFLKTCAAPHLLSTDRVQRGFLGALRHGLRAAGREARRRVAAKATRLAGSLQPERRLALAAELPEPILKDLWAIDAPVLLVPKGMEPEPPGKASPDQPALAAWLGVLDRALDSPDNEGVHQPILQAVQGLLQTLSAKERGLFLREHRTLRVIGVRDARSEVEKPVSVEYLDQIRRAGCLFTFADGLRKARMGIARQLARAMPDADVCLVRAPIYRELFSEDEAQGGGSRLPAASDGRACLAAVGRYTGRLGSLTDRRGLLEKANDPVPDADARRGLRFLLHGSLDHRGDDDAKLWIGRRDQHPAWNRLWTVMHKTAEWSLVADELANAIPRSRWSSANIAEIDARTLIDKLRNTGQGIDAPKEFSVDERDEILSRIEDEYLWRRLSLHTTLDGEPVSAAHEGVYVATRTGGHEDPLTREATLIAPSHRPTVSDQQGRWLPPLDNRARIEIALGAEKPVRYWHDVMDALDRLSTPLDEDLRAGLRSKAWLSTIHPAPVKPEDVIDLQGSLSDETHRLVAEYREAHGPCFAVPADLDAAVRDHKAWPRLREVSFSSGDAGLERLGLLLEDLPNYHIGKWTERPRSDATGLLARYDDLPGWRLLEMAAELFDSEVAWNQLGPALSKKIKPQRLAAVLGWLGRDNDQWELRKSAHDDYLRQLTAHGQIAREHLPRLRLASADCRWQEAAELCVGAHGVVHGSLLDTKQALILRDHICQAESGARGDQPDALQVDFQHARSEAPGILRDYFMNWDSSLVPQPMIGVMLALLGPDVRELANEYLHPHSFGWLVRELPWCDPGTIPERIECIDRIVADVREGIKAVEPRDIALNFIQADVRVETRDKVEVHNLLGHPILVALDANPSTLLAGAPSWQGGRGVMIPLRYIEPDRFQPERLSELLRATAEQIDSDLYHQKNADFGSLWQEMAKSDQLEIGIARRLILDHIPFYLRQLSVKRKRIGEQLKICDSLRRRSAEADAGEDGQSAESARTELHQVLDELAECIDGDPDEQQAVVQAVKSKLEQYQYDVSSIPLELFQNADDAAVELGQCHAYRLGGSEVPESARRFVVEEREDGLGFLHWGRPINHRGPVGFDGEGRGYDRDLEKMLILSATDKPGDEGVTGKFGLGFKSVLLACEQPRILSGRLAIRVVAGILPQPWEDVREARQRLTAFSTDSRQPGTLIDLPGVERELRARVLERFRQLAGILCVFGRAVRSVTHVPASDSESKSSWSWEPNKICPDVEVGELHLRDDWGARTRAICVRAGDGSLLMALGPQGFRPLPAWVPALWVTAPTKEPSAVGFAVNGSFDLDAGRGRLAGDTGKNLNEAGKIGRQTGGALGALLERSHEDWNSVRADLGLAADLDALGFWESVWSGLTKGWLRRTRRDGEDLSREAALGALARLCKHPRAIPNGLKGSLRGFSDASDIHYELSGVLLREDVGEKLSAWERFTNRYPARKCVSKEIGSILREADLCRPRFLGLSALAGLLECSKVEPADAEVLGRLRLLTEEEEKDWESDDLRERLNGLLFRSEADKWTEARKLLAIQGPLDPDEPRRHELAPPECRLHADYYTERDDEWPAIIFFLACRQRMEAPADTLAQWVLDAESVEARSAALGYLADGDLGEWVAERVRERGWLRTVFNDPGLTSRLKEEQRHKLRRRLVSREQLQRAFVDADEWEQGERVYNQVDLPTALGQLYEWWSSEGVHRAREHRNCLYPQGSRSLDLEPDPETGRPDRSSWFMLLALGSFQGMGHAREEQHRGFIQHCQDKGWWNIFTCSDPKREPERWMDIIEEYAEAQHDDEKWMQWLGQFPKLYRLRRWLDEYVDLFLSMDRSHRPFTLDTILAPRSSSQLQGGGIDAPPLTRTLKVGAHFVVRELLHNGAIENPFAIPHAYAPIRRVKDFFETFRVDVSTSKDIHDNLKNHLGEERAAFCGDYDIPLRIISSDASLRAQVLNRRGQ